MIGETGKWLVAVLATASLGSGAFAVQEGATPAPANATTTVLARTSTTITGQPLAVPEAGWEVVFSVSDLPVGGALPMHKHPWPRYAFVERGRLRVRYEAAGLEREFGAGEAVVEAIDQWHEGRVVGDEPVRLIVMDQLPPGENNVVRR